MTTVFETLKAWLRAGVLVLALPGIGICLDPAEIMLVANGQSPDGVELAQYYARQRAIPATRLLKLNLPPQETCSRIEYELKIATPVRKALSAIAPPERIRCLVLFYGIPLRVKPAISAERQELNEFKSRQAALQEKIEAQEKNGAPSDTALSRELDYVRDRLNQLKVERDQVASVDSELTVVKATDAPIGGWIENPFYIGFRNRPEKVAREEVLMVSRLDGPTAQSVRRIIDDTLDAEKKGLSGKAYFDARWPYDPSSSKALSGYKLYDASIHRAAEQVRKDKTMPVTLDSTEQLFQPGQAPNAALYCGWYRLATYVDAFDWQKGAVGYHIASSECTTLKKEGSQVWCKRMIEEGVCATVGPVGEPYVQGLPHAGNFFRFTDRRNSVACGMLYGEPSISIMENGPDRRSALPSVHGDIPPVASIFPRQGPFRVVKRAYRRKCSIKRAPRRRCPSKPISNGP